MNPLFQILDIIFPHTCGICGKINQNSLCNSCKRRLQTLELAKKQIKIRQEEDYTLCYLFSYQDLIRDKIIEFKFKDKPELAKMFAKILVENEKTYRLLKSYDIIIPVPSDSVKKWKRGYNQTERICKELTKFGLNCGFGILKKIKKTKRQEELNQKERENNLIGAYKVQNKEKIQNKKVLILDDVYTTGSTIKECAKMLREAEATSIGAVVIAKD